MPKVILDIPKDKIQPFLNAIVQLGIKDNAIQANFDNTTNTTTIPFTFSKFLLFDWEFFSNELEFE
ncbi:MAG: hypothetical protein V9E96_11030 [Chitinophagaceae bacterium]|jgi:hypothetical protein